jgi:4-hydroxy-tetrahydrodipicolinate reductase
MKSNVLIGLHGASGKMGQMILKLAKSCQDITIAYQYSRSLDSSNLDELFNTSDVIIDFSSAQALGLLLDKAQQFSKKLLIGTTGISSQHQQQMLDLAKKAAVFYSPNTSVCVSLLAKMLKIAAAKLPASQYDVDIIDLHHRQKLDSPSGTALMFAKNIDDGRGSQSARVVNRAIAGARNPGDIDFFSMRSGSQPAKLEVRFSGSSEHIAFEHQAYSRSAFASQALRIAVWLSKMPAAFYTMDEYIDL